MRPCTYPASLFWLMDEQNRALRASPARRSFAASYSSKKKNIICSGFELGPPVWRALQNAFLQAQTWAAQAHAMVMYHGLKIDTKTKCHNLKLLTCKETLRQVFIRVYRLEITSVMFVFSTQICELLPSNLLSGSTPSPFLLWIIKMYRYIVCKVPYGIGYGVPGFRQLNTGRKVPLQVSFLQGFRSALI